MINGDAAGSAIGVVYAAMTDAIKAMGVIVQVEPHVFEQLLRLQAASVPLVVFSPVGFFKKNQYLTAYKGLVFYTKTSTALTLPAYVELIQAKKIWIPNM
ncbi:MAG: hypothetical protein KBI46_00750 [Phycisphaerae bacterium]|nr:hypothetical protein [Phycisphaerae bacterium]